MQEKFLSFLEPSFWKPLLNRVRQQILGKRWQKFCFTKEYQAFSDSVPGSSPQMFKVMIQTTPFISDSTIRIQTPMLSFLSGMLKVIA
jgi:hypothetical protein